jgi:hypothetical protein
VASAALLILVADSAWHTSTLSPEPIFVLGRHDVRWLIAGLIGAALLAWLPTPRGWRAPEGHRSTALLVGLWLLPAAIVLSAYGQGWAVLAQMRPQITEVAALNLPVAPGAQNLQETQRTGNKTLRFEVPAKYPSVAVASFYERWFLAQGWRQIGAPKWLDLGGYELKGDRPARSQAEWSYGELWQSADGKLEVMLDLSYKTPTGIDPHLPPSRWHPEWLSVAHVSVVAYAGGPRRSR